MIEFRPVGWEPMQADWWPAIAASLPRPWPREAVCMDLRWWRGQEIVLARKLLPGRPALQQRWGWKEWDARLILREEAIWKDPRREETAVPKLSSDSPAALQPLSSDSPAASTTNAENLTESSSDSPAALQPLSSDSPSRDLLSPDHRSPITDHRSLSPQTPLPAEQLPSNPEREPDPPDQKQEKEQEISEPLSLYQLFGPAIASALTRAGISDLTDLTRLTARQCRMLKGIGEGNLATIQLRLQALGLAFADGRVAATGATDPDPPEIKKRTFNPQPQRKPNGNPGKPSTAASA